MEAGNIEAERSDLERMRHSLAHVLAQAVLQLRPQAKLGFGPAIDTGCYYDFLFEEPLSTEDFPVIEKAMRRIIAQKQTFTQHYRSGPEAQQFLLERGEGFKAEYCAELAAQGESQIGFYVCGPFEDMCAGPHVEHTGRIVPDAFKIDSLAGAYWRGDEKNIQLTRIYCLAFGAKAELVDFIERRRLAEERDHRKLGKELEIFMISEEVGAGLPLWLPNGTVVRDELEAFGKETESRHGYQRVATPHIAREELYQTSGHLPYYKDSMFPPMELEGESRFYLKAMNCPHHHLIYRHRPRSYRELPLRLAEYGVCYRYESSGSLAGLLRVRSMAMNDAHIYCRVSQMKAELVDAIQMTLDYYRLFRFEGIRVRLSTHDPQRRDKFVDNPELWAYSEKVVQEVLEDMQVNYFVGAGEAAFYGPKIDYEAKTVVGREETISTAQLDFASALNFDLTYTTEEGREERPYIVHRAPLSTHERFVAFLIEHLGGAFPTWLAPVQAQIVPVSTAFYDQAQQLEERLRDALFRVQTDYSSNSFNKKIRLAVTHKIPNILILGGKEVESETVTLRRYCVKDQLVMPQAALLERLRRLREQRIMDCFADVVVPDIVAAD